MPWRSASCKRTRSKRARLFQVVDALLKQRRDDEVVARDLAVSSSKTTYTSSAKRRRMDIRRSHTACSREDRLDDLGAELELTCELPARLLIVRLVVLGRDRRMRERDEDLRTAEIIW